MIAKMMNDKLDKLREELEDVIESYDGAGIRFEDKSRKVGDIIRDKSKHNIGREDERDFPDYESEQYDELDDLDGVSAWKLDSFKFEGSQNMYLTNHCYLIGSNDITYDDGFLLLDDNEIIMNNAKVLAVIF